MWSYKKQGTKWYGMVDGGNWEYIGSETTYQTNLGLFQPASMLSSLIYHAPDWVGAVGHWAYVMVPTANAESAYRLDRINTYDSVSFTFGFLQLAAHTGDDNLALVIRKFLADPTLAPWFPDLVLKDGVIQQKLPNGTFDNLEKAPAGTWKAKKLMAYLNSDSKVIDEREKANALKFIHLTHSSPIARRLQVEASAQACRRKIGYWPEALADRVPDSVLSLVVSHLHWRGGTDAAQMRSLQALPDPETKILNFINSKDANRSAALKKGLQTAKANGWLGTKTYLKATKTFE